MTRHRTHGVAIAVWLVALATTVVSACGQAPAQSSGPSATAASSSVPSVIPSATATPRPTGLPTPTLGAWVPAGTTARDYFTPPLLALPDGAALLLASLSDPDVILTELWEPETGWREGATADGGRTKFGAVVLRDGRVLVAGGGDARAQSLASASIYDPAAATWAPIAPMAQARTDPATALLPDGRVLVAGGYFYDPEPYPESGSAPRTDLVRALRPATEASTTGRSGLHDVVLPPRGPALATAEVFDPATGAWSPTGSMRYARTGPAIATLVDGRVLVVGAAEDYARIDERAFTTAEVYDPASGEFSGVAALPGIDRSEIRGRGVQVPDAEPLPGMTGSLVALPAGGAVLVGNQVYWKHEGEVIRTFRLDAGLTTWDEILPAFAQIELPGPGRSGPFSRAGAVTVGLADGSVLLAGGHPGGEWGWGAPGVVPVSVERYMPGEDAWSALPDLPEQRLGWIGTRLADGTVLVVGGTFATEPDYQIEWGRAAYRLGFAN